MAIVVSDARLGGLGRVEGDEDISLIEGNARFFILPLLAHSPRHRHWSKSNPSFDEANKP